ncbi:hypothetical protein GCM10010503_39430 [Streptomyces lucensis JCM 4490]|uniref:Uncharacterized protein n=1 Tax=Streptomyces lucensis JCM 4490 TaxID=1306176 RepID=A0A918J868_9ACTN|nr:hypothetical protein GCM10010503_39430 [Streptomyces lucensis JCM 4490]
MRHSVRFAVAAAVAASLTGSLMAVSADSAVAAGSKLVDDFNGDGYRDLAIGMPENYDPAMGEAERETASAPPWRALKPRSLSRACWINSLSCSLRSLPTRWNGCPRSTIAD